MTQDCGPGNVYEYPGVLMNQSYFLDRMPNNFVGTCVLSSSASDYYAASDPDITIYFTTNSLSILQPPSNAPLYADQVSLFTIAADPTTPETFTIEFVPINAQTQNYQQSGIPATPNYPFLVPSFLYGYYFLNLINYPSSIYPAPMPVFLYVVQQLKLETPKSGAIIDPFSPIPFLVGANSSTMNVFITLSIACPDQSEDYFDVQTNSIFLYSNPRNLAGHCIVSFVPNPSPYLTAFDPVSITLAVLIVFSIVPNQVVNGGKFEILIKSLNAKNVPATLTLQIDCDGFLQVFYNVGINVLVTLTLNLTVSGLGPFSCKLSNLPSLLFNTISAPIELLIPLNQEEKESIAKSLFIPQFISRN